MQPGVVALRGGLIAAWEDDLRAARQDAFDPGRGREALVFIQRYYGLISTLRPQIQRAWGAGGHVHVVDSPEVGGPGPRVSQSRLRLKNYGDLVLSELFSYADGSPRPNPAAGLDRELKVVDVEPIALVTDFYRLAADFLQHALNVDLVLDGSMWLYEHVAARQFVEGAGWSSVGDVYRRASREFAVADSFETVASSFSSKADANGSSANGTHPASNGSSIEGPHMRLSIDQLQRFVEPQPDLENFLQLVRIAVDADREDRLVESAAIGVDLGLDPAQVAKLGELAAHSADVAREGTFELEQSSDPPSWSFRPSYNVHFFRRVHTLDDFLLVAASLLPRAAADGTTTTSPGTSTEFKVEEGTALPDGVVTFLMTDVVESTPMWLQSRAAMYQAMRRHDQLLTHAIEAHGGIVLKERGEGDSFFAVFPRATDAVIAAVGAQEAIQSEPWPERLSLSVRMAVLTGEADAADRDYRSPAVNRCAKLRRRAVGRQILVSETTYSIVADILRSDIRLVSVGKRHLEGHDRPEEIYVVQHPEVRLEATVAQDAIGQDAAFAIKADSRSTE